MQSLCLASCHCLLIHHHIFTSRLRKFNLSKTKLPKSTHQNLFFNWATCHNSSTSEEAGGLEFKDNFTSSRSYLRSGLLSHTFDPSLDYRWSARTARATQESPVLALYTFMSFPTVLSAQFHSRCTNHPFLFPFLTSLTLCNPASSCLCLQSAGITDTCFLAELHCSWLWTISEMLQSLPHALSVFSSNSGSDVTILRLWLPTESMHSSQCDFNPQCLPVLTWSHTHFLRILDFYHVLWWHLCLQQ